MVSRMDKYNSDTDKPAQSRFKKNGNLYENLYNNKIETEFSGIDSNVVDLSTVTNSTNRRENYQRSRLSITDNNISNEDSISNKKEIDDPMDRNYNINDILNEARKKREDNNENKKQLKSVEYSIISDLSQEKLNEYREKKNKMSKDEEENLEELIHTITSNSLRKKIDDELLSDLLPSDEKETLVSKELLENVENELEKEKTNINLEDTSDGIDRSFYTKSMDLSEEDFVKDEEDLDDMSFIEDTKTSPTKVILIILFVIIIIDIIGYIIYKFI